MAHGWDSYLPNLPPRSPDPRSLRRPAESVRPPSHHIGNFVGHHNFSGRVGSREVPASNANFNVNYCRNTSFQTPRSDCAYNRYYDRQWQGDRPQMGRDYPQRFRSRDLPNYAANQFPILGSYRPSSAPDFHHPKQDRDMRAPSYRGNYSAINNFSDTDAREARPSCKFTRNNFFPRPKTDIVSNDSSTKYSFSATGNRNSQNERLYPNMSESSSFSDKDYRERNHSSAASYDVRTKGNEYYGKDYAFHYQKQKLNMDGDLSEPAYSDFHLAEKCSGVGNRQHIVNKEDDLQKSTDDQDTVLSDNELEKTQALEKIWEKSGALDEEFFDENSLIPNSNCEDEIMEKNRAQLLVLNESSSSNDNDDEQSESISSSNNHDFEFTLQLPEPESCESLGEVSDHSSDCKVGTNISQEKEKDEEFSSTALEEKSTFPPEVDRCRPVDTRYHSFEEMKDPEMKVVASDESLLSSHSSGTDEYLQTGRNVSSTEKSKMLSEVPDCDGTTAIKDILMNSVNSEEHLVHAASCLQPSSSGTDIDPTVKMEEESLPEKTTSSLSQDVHAPKATVGSFFDGLGDKNHTCVESQSESLLKKEDLVTNLDTVFENGSPPLKNATTSTSPGSSPTAVSENNSVDTNNTFSNSELPLKQDSSDTVLHIDQDMRSPPDKEGPNSPLSQESCPSTTQEIATSDNCDIINSSESLHPNLFNTDLLPNHPEECPNQFESKNSTSHTDTKCITRAVKTGSNTQRDMRDLNSCLDQNVAADDDSWSEEESISQENENSINESFAIQEQTENYGDFPEDANDSFEKLDFSPSEPGLLYGEPLSGEESSTADVKTYDQETPGMSPETTPKQDLVDQLVRPVPQLTSSVHLRPFLHPVVLLMDMESTDEMSNTYNCGDCPHTANNVDHLIKHHYCCHSMPSYQFCKTCNVYLIKNELGKPHQCDQIISQTKKNCGPYKCSRCGLLFSRILHYVRHMRHHTGRTPYRCSGCGLYFSQTGALNHHKRVPGRCRQSLLSKKIDDLSIKTKRQTQKKQMQMSTYESMTQCYVKLVDISKTNVCNLCGKIFPTSKKTKKHIYNVHKRKKVSALSSQNEVNVHKGKKVAALSEQNETSPLYKCPLCPRHFKYSYNRARHLRFCVRNAIYGGKKKVGDKYVCPLCKATFTATCNRYRHIKLTCLRETLNRLARGKLRLHHKAGKENEQKPQSKDSTGITQEKEGEAHQQAPQGSTTRAQYKCSHCPAMFFHPSGKYRHMKKHELFKLTGKIIKYRKSALAKPESAGDKTAEESDGQPDATKEFPKPTLSCRFCGLGFRVLSTLKRHQRSHRGERPYRCLECRKGFKQLHHLIGHRVVHQKRIQCTVCRKILPTVGDLIQHRSSHLKKGLLQCPECPAQFQYPVYLLRHLKTHRNTDTTIQKPETETPMEPQQCSESVEEMKGPKMLQCSLCKETFDDAHILRKHSLTHISGSLNQCPYCRNRFTSRHSLTRHMIKHTGDKPFSCVNCGRQFYRSIYLKIHSETCTSPRNNHPTEANSSNQINKRYFCTICPRRFWKRIRLEKHLKAHKKKSLHRCEDCGQYYGVNMISRHKLICIKTEDICSDKSTNLRFESSSTQVSQNVQKIPASSDANKMEQFKCPSCPKGFRYKSLLLRHTISHTGLQPFRCMHCDQRFRSNAMCKEHEHSCDKRSKTDQAKLIMKSETDMDSQNLPPEAETGLKCKFCTKTFLKARSLRRHILTHNEVKPYRCKACDSCFSRYDHLKVHQALCKSKKTRLEVRIPKISLEDIGKGWQSKLDLEPHDEQDSFDCKVCLKSFPTESRLSRHTTMFHTVKRFKCSGCGSAFSHEKTLRAHRRVKKCKKARNESSTPLQETDQPSDNISKQLDGIRKKILVKIQPLFNKDLKFICSYCPRAFKNSWQLNVHTRLHTGERPYSCEHCGERFIRSDYLVRHYTKCKDMTQPSNALCDRCGGFFSEKQLENHKKTCVQRSCSPTVSKIKQPSSQSPPKGFSCAYCSSRFLLFAQLQDHFSSTHKLEMEASLETAAPLQQLLSNIPKIKEEPVDESYGKVSGNGADVSSNPDKGLTSDMSDLFVCQMCNMCFTNKAGLIGHQRAHAKQTPYSCKTCKKGFWNKTQLRNHTRKCRRAIQRLDIPVKEEIDGAFSGLKSKDNFENASTITSAKILPTNAPCKKESEESTPISHGNEDQSSNSSTEKKTVQYQCSECDKSFTDGLLLISHLEDHGREEQERKTNKCSKCGRVFSNQGNLRRHMKLHMTRQRFYCSSCPKMFSTMSELEKHNSSHDGDKPFSCKLCEQCFLTRLALCEHYRGDHADEIFNCQFCSKLYASKRSLYRHYKKWHPKDRRDMRSAQLQRGSVDQQSSSYVSTNGDSDEDQNLDSDSDSDSAPYFPCHVCGKTFPTSESLEDHQLCHLGKKPHECAECGKCFFQASQLQQHQRMHKSEFQCQICGRGFVSLFALRNHKHSHGKSRPFRCSKCELGFAGPTQLAEHMSTHREESFPCDICNKIFQCKSSRAEHRKTHSMLGEGAPPVSKEDQEKSKSALGYTTEFKYRCGICTERFRDPEELSEHGCLEAVERPYICTVCQKHFLHSSHLKKHRNTHHKTWSDREYPCNQCNSSFSSSQLFLSHLKTHVGTARGAGQERDPSEGFICPVCHLCFASATELVLHFPTHPDCAPEREKIKRDSSEGQLEEQNMLYSTASTEYECGQCGAVFLGKEALRHHHCSLQQKTNPADESRAHEAAWDEEEVDVTGEDLYKCHECLMQFSSKSSLLEHQNNQHPNNWKEFKCETCGKAFAKKRYLRKHELRQHGPKEHATTTADLGKNFKCIQCQAKFHTARDLSNHMRLHAEKQAGDYRCDMCYKSFSKRSLLRQHQESHVGEVVYECTECDKAFAFPHLLEEHQRSHSN